jgi:hypothetical protein
MHNATVKMWNLIEFHTLYHILYSSFDKDLWPDDGLMKKAETCNQLLSYNM